MTKLKKINRITLLFSVSAAEVAESVDAQDSGFCGVTPVRVRISSSAPYESSVLNNPGSFSLPSVIKEFMALCRISAIMPEETTNEQQSIAGKAEKKRRSKFVRNLRYLFKHNRKQADSQPPDGENGEPVKKPNKLLKAAAKTWTKTVDGVGFSVAFGTAAVSSLLLFRILNKTKVYGLNNIPSEHENVLYCINHNSLLDNFIFEAAAYVPKIFFNHKYLPINLADRKNFFGDPTSKKFRDRVMRFLGRHFFRHLKAYPVDRKTGNLNQVDEWRELLKNNIVIVYPEGTRSRTGEVGHGKPGVGKLIYDARPIVMPVYMDGTAAVLGVGMKFPTVFKTIKVYIGKPMDLSDMFVSELPADRVGQMKYYAEISEAVMQEIRSLNPNYRKKPDAETSPPEKGV